MISRELIESFSNDTQQNLWSAILTIGQSGVLELQMQQNLMSLVSGSADEDPDELTHRILQHRKKEISLREFIELTHEAKERVK